MRKRFLGKFMSLMLVFCMLTPSIASVVSAAETSEIPVYSPSAEMAKWFRVETFNDKTVGQALSAEFTKGVVADYNGQRAFKISPSSSSLTNEFRQLAIGQWCVSFDIAAPNNNFNGYVKMEGGGDSKRDVATFAAGKIKNHSGDEVGTVGSAFTRVTVVVTPSEKKYSMWVGGTKVTDNAYYNANPKVDKAYVIYINFSSNDSSQKDIYLDNVVIQSTGVASDYCPVYNPNAYVPREQPLVFTEAPDRVYTEKYGSFSSVTNAMSSRTAIHMRSGVIYDGTGNNRRLDNMPYEENGEFMVPVDAFEDLLGVEPTVAGDTITLGSYATLTVGQETATLGGSQTELLAAPARKGGVIYLPLSAIATEGFSKTICHETNATYSPGAVIIGDTTYTPPVPGSNSLQFLNDMLFAERPTWQEIAADYNASPLKGQHPRIFITDAGIQNLKNEIAASDIKRNWYNRLLSAANSNIGRDPFEWYLPDGVRMLTQASDFEYFIRVQGMAYLLTGEERYAEDAWEKIVSVAMMPDWNSAHALDAGTYAGGFALAYDWFYDWLSEDQKDFMYEHAYRNFMWLANETYKGVDFGMDNVIYRNNHNSVVNSGVIMMAIAFFDENTEFCARLTSEAIRCLEYVIQKFGPEGYWDEGVSYLHMTLFYTVMALASLETVFDDCYTLDLWQGFDKAADQLTYAQSDVSGYNYGNAEMGWSTTIALFWFFDHFNMEGIADTLAYNPRFLNTYTADLVNLLMWYRPTGGNEPVYTLDKIWRSPEEDVVTARNSYDDGQVFVGFKSRTLDGVNRDYGHMDAGSFVFDAEGVRWAYDMGKDDYNLPGYTSGGPDKFKIFRLRAAGHNTLIINPGYDPEHAEDGGGGIIEYDAKPRGVKGVVDMTESLIENVTDAKRGFLFTDERNSLVIRDEVSLKGQSDLMWLMYIKANYQVDGNTIILTDTKSPSKKVKVEFISNVPGTARVESAAPLATAPVVSGQKTNSEYNRIVYQVSGSGNVNITAKITPLSYEESSSIYLYNRPISEWYVPDGEGPSDPVWQVVGYGNNKANATDVEIVNMGGFWAPTSTTGNPKFNVIIPEGAIDVEVKVNGIVREGIWEESDTSNNYIMQFDYADCCFAGENQVTVTAVYPSGRKSATGKFHAVCKPNIATLNQLTLADFTENQGDISNFSTTGASFTTINGSLNSTSDEGYMVYSGPQASNARLVRSYGGSIYGSREKYINFRYYTSSDDAVVKINCTAAAENANPVILPTAADKWFTVGVRQPNYKYYNAQTGAYERHADVYVNGEFVGRIVHASFATDTGVKIIFNAGTSSSDFIAFDYFMMHYMSTSDSANRHTVFPLGIDAYDPSAGFSKDAFQADETKTFPVGTNAVAIRVSKGRTAYSGTDGGLNDITALYRNGLLVDPSGLTFSLVKDTTDTTNDAEWFILVESETPFEKGFYTVATDSNEPFCGDGVPLVSIGGTFTIE